MRYFPGILRQRQRQIFHCYRLVFRIPLQEFRWTAHTFSVRRWFRLFTWLPHRDAALNTGNIRHPPLGKLLTELRVVSITCISQHHTGGHTAFTRSFDLTESDLWFGLKRSLVGNSRLAPPFFIAGPHFRKIQAKRNRHAGVFSRRRKAYRNPAVILLANLSTVLPCDANRVLSLLRKTGIVNYPGNDRTFSQHGRQNRIQRAVQQRFIVPGSFGDQMMQGLMHTPHMIRIESRRHRLYALAFARQKQTRAVRLERNNPVRVSGRLRQAVEVCDEPFLLCAWRPR